MGRMTRAAGLALLCLWARGCEDPVPDEPGVPEEMLEGVVRWSSHEPGQYRIALNPDRPDQLELQGDVVVDHRTGLMWAREFREFTPGNVNDPRVAVEAAWKYCRDLELAGYDDWRLPTRLELFSIADLTRRKPAIDPELFPNTYTQKRSPYWTISPQPAENQFFVVCFEDGAISFDGDVTRPVRARCVRTVTPPEPVDQVFVVGDETVLDNRTGLEWERYASHERFPDAPSAAAHCASLDKAGGGWRLPTARELNTLVDETEAFPAIDSEAFPDTESDWYWTSTPYAHYENLWWAVTFADHAMYNNEAGYGYARCVR